MSLHPLERIIGFQNRSGKRVISKSYKPRVTRGLENYRIRGLKRVKRNNSGALTRKRLEIYVIK